MISLALRAGVPVESIIDQAMSIRPCKSYTDRTKSKGDTSKGTSCPSAIGYALKELQEKINARYFVEEDCEDENTCEEICDDVRKEDKKVVHNNPKCPECGAELAFEGGCNSCKNCGWSKCDL